MTPQERFRIKHRERIRIKMREWRASHPEKVREHGRKHYHAKIARLSPEKLSEFRSKQILVATKKYKERKEMIFAAYGGYVCACCGETEKSFLSVDHIHNNAQQMIRDGLYKRGSASFYNWLVKNEFPSGFQILCMNCQFGKKNNKGICPHKGKV